MSISGVNLNVPDEALSIPHSARFHVISCCFQTPPITRNPEDICCVGYGTMIDLVLGAKQGVHGGKLRCGPNRLTQGCFHR
jgi:hypothetical protein